MQTKSQMPDTDIELDDINLYVTNLPVVTTQIVGRQDEAAWIAALLQRPSVRLVTLTGVGGVGKTRLAVQVAGRLFDLFPDGVYFIDLAPLQEPAAVLPTIVHTLQLIEDREKSPLDLLKQALRHKRLLLVVDNFEHLEMAAPLIGALLAGSAGLKVLATSRSALRLVGEHEFPVSPLPLPDSTHPPALEELAANPAVLLFAERAQAVRPDFQLAISNAASVAEICMRLDGLPLAIELAAARSKILAPQALLARLAKPLVLLTGGAKDSPARQQTLHRTIAWSVDLLDERERQLFRRLAVFDGGFDIEAAKAICFDDGAAPASIAVDEYAVIDMLGALVEKNLLVQTEQDDGEPRFKLLQLLQEFAFESLDAAGEVTMLRERHLAYFVALAENAEPKLTSHEQLIWMARLDREYDNIRSALMASVTLPYGAREGLRLASALWWYWFIRGTESEWRRWLEPLLDLTAAETSTPVTLPTRMTALTRLALLHCWWDERSKAESIARTSLQMAESMDDVRCSSWAHYALGEIMSIQNPQQSRSHLEEALHRFRTLHDKRGVCWSLIQLGAVAMQENDFVTAMYCYEDGLAVARTMGDRSNIGGGLYCLGVLAQEAGDFDQAEQYFADSLRNYRLINNLIFRAVTLDALAYINLVKGDNERGRIEFTECLVLGSKLGIPLYISGSLVGLAACAAATRKFFLSGQLFGAASAQIEISVTLSYRSPAERAYYESVLSITQTQLGEAAFASAWSAGLALTPDEAIALVNTASSQKQTNETASMPGTVSQLPAGLTVREVDVLRLVTQGMTNAEIAENLIVSPFTVNAHLRNIYNKIGTSVRREAIRFAREHNLV